MSYYSSQQRFEGSGQLHWLERGRLVFAAIPGAIFSIVFIFRARDQSASRSFTLFDDAMISMSYARTLAETGEWVWFPGAERVQGISNPLWTLWMALLHKFGLSGSSAALAVSLSGALIIAAISVVAGRIVQEATSELRWSRLSSGSTSLAIPFMYPLAFWTLRGMEVGFLALLALLSVLIFLKVEAAQKLQDRRLQSPLLILAFVGVSAVVTRIDASIAIAVVLVYLLVCAKDRRTRRQIFLVVGIPVALALVALMAFQAWYWGDLLPNTYRLKVEGHSLGERIARGIGSAAKSIPLVVLIVSAIWVIRRYSLNAATRRLGLVLASVALSTILYSVWTGGDAWEGYQILNRFVAVSLPIFAVLVAIAFAVGMEHLRESWSLRNRRTVVVFGVFVIISSFGMSVLVTPFRISAEGLGIAVASTTLGGLILLKALEVSQTRAGLPRRLAAIAGLCTLILVPAGAYGWAQWVIRSGFDVVEDARQTEIGYTVREITLPGATVATMWAGAPTYYSERSMIDLLGKNDRVVATGMPAKDSLTGKPVAFFPGHSKYDLTWSINTLKPDLVLAAPSDDFRRGLSTLGYKKIRTTNSFVFWAREESQNIVYEKISTLDMPEDVRFTRSKSIDTKVGPESTRD